MSAEPQPRRRKDKRRRKDASSSERSKAEADLIARKLSVADDSDEGPPPAPKSHSSTSHSSSQSFTEGDSVIHVDHDHGTGGHWCAKIVFFVLLGILVGLIGLIIIENRGLTDLDTPVAESRFSQVFDGWVDEGPIHDDHHDEHTLELKHDDEHDDEHDEELSDNHDEEIEDIDSEVQSEGNSDDEHAEDSDAEEEEEEEHVAAEEEEQLDEEDNAEDQNDDDDDDNDNVDADEDEQDNDDDEEDQISNEDDDNDSDENAANNSHEMEDDNDDDEEEALHGDDISNEIDENDDESLENNNISKEDFENFKDAPFDEIDSGEEDVVDNTAGEEELLEAKRAEQLAQEQEDNGNMGLRVGVGLALVTVTYCVLARKWRNAFESADDAAESELNRRMTLIPNEPLEEKSDDAEGGEEPAEDEEEDEGEEEIIPIKKVVPPTQAIPQQTSIFGKRPQQIVHKYEEEFDDEVIIKPVAAKPLNIEPPKKEYKEVEVEEVEEVSDEEVEEEEELEEDVEEDEIEIEEPIPVKKTQEIKSEPVVQEPAAEENEEEYEDEEVEEEEELEDEEVIEEEEIEEDVSDEIDDTELMKKLEAKYGKLPDVDDEAEGQSDDEKPVVPARRRGKPTGGNSVDAEWADWKRQLDLAQAEMDEGKVEVAYRHFKALSSTNPSCWRAKLGIAKALDILAEKKKNNNLLQSAIDMYQEVLNATNDNDVFLNVADRLINRIRFRGKHIDGVSVHKTIIEKFPSVPKYRNELAITYLMANKIEQSRSVLKETLKLWPNDGVALVHHGFILKTIDNNLREAVKFLQKGVDTGDAGTKDGRFLFHLGDALARLGQNDDAKKVYELGADLKVFLSPLQRSLYNVDRLTGHPWWKIEKTPYKRIVRELEANWEKIAEEARRLRTEYRSEQESLKDTGDWSQYELFIRGSEIKNHCSKCPVTCRIARSEPAASGCRRGQVKFSAMTPGTHVFAHTGPTNCRLRAHLGLQGTKDTYIRVGDEIRSWEEGKVFIFDDSFEHEVWHNGTSLRIVLIVDLWHPELTEDERASLPSI